MDTPSVVRMQKHAALHKLPTPPLRVDVGQYLPCNALNSSFQLLHYKAVIWIN